MSWIAVVATVVSVGANAYSQHQQAKQQDSELASQLRNQQIKQHQADAKTAALIKHEGQLSDAPAKQTALAKFTDAIQANKANATKPLDQAGAVSDAYKAAGSNAALGITDQGGKFADLISSIDAPMQTRRADQRAIDDYGQQIDQIKRFSAGDDFLSNMRLRGIKPNPWLGALSGVAGGFAGSHAGSGGGSSAPDAYSGWLDNNSTYAGPY